MLGVIVVVVVVVVEGKGSAPKSNKSTKGGVGGRAGGAGVVMVAGAGVGVSDVDVFGFRREGRTVLAVDVVEANRAAAIFSFRNCSSVLTGGCDGTVVVVAVVVDAAKEDVGGLGV